MIITHLVMFKFFAGASESGDSGSEWEMIPPWKKHRRLAANVTRT